MKDVKFKFYMYKTYHNFYNLENKNSNIKVNFFIYVAEIVKLLVLNNQTICLFTFIFYKI